MTKYVNKKTVVIAVVAIAAVSAILVAAALTPRPVGAFGPRHWMQGDSAGAFGPGHFGGYGGMYDANWTGTVPLESVRDDLIESIKSKVNVSVSETESAAKQALGDGSEVCCVTLAPINGYLVYVVHGIDSSNNPHRIIVDAGDGQVLDNAEVDFGGFGQREGHGYGGGMWR